MQDKINNTENLIIKLKDIAKKSIVKGKYDKALASLSACADVLYESNQRYKDDEIEDMLLELGDKIISVPDDFKPKNIKPVKTVLYYDGFGLDLRGLAINMTSNIASLGYKLIYVTHAGSKGKQNHIVKELEGYDVEYVYLDTDSGYLKWALELNQVFQKYCPQVAYFYTTPFDVSGTIVFNMYKDRVIRFLVNLTDHAFWIGLNAFDYCSASRSMGAWINMNGRGIPLDKMYRNKTRIYINEKIELGPLPFDTEKYRYVFSGGALYKTLGDDNNYFYRMVEHIVSNYSDVNFLYAGYGDRSQFDILIKKYPGRVFLINEREDFYQIIQGSVFFLNTYPMFGGQMMRYSAYAKRLPVTLKHNDDGQGILFHQEDLGIEFASYEQIINEIDNLLTDDEYRKSKEEKLNMAVVSKEEADKNYRQIIETQESPYPVIIEEFDTSEFQKEYIDRLDYNKLEENCLLKKNNFSLSVNFPKLFFRDIWCKVLNKIKKK